MKKGRASCGFSKARQTDELGKLLVLPWKADDGGRQMGNAQHMVPVGKPTDPVIAEPVQEGQGEFLGQMDALKV